MSLRFMHVNGRWALWEPNVGQLVTQTCGRGSLVMVGGKPRPVDRRVDLDRPDDGN